jgi:hypothetical protein
MTETIRLVSAHPAGRGAVAITRGEIGLHVGIVFRASDQRCRILHLAWHYRLRNEEALDGWAFVAPLLDPVELQVLAGFCALLGAVRPRIPYGLQFSASRFDDDGRFIPGPGETGLTCTTFVMAIFEWAVMPLLVRESWKVRDEDIAAQRALVSMLRETKDADDGHVIAVEAEVGCMRFRSEEAAAASAMPVRPVHFDEAELAGARVRASFDALA